MFPSSRIRALSERVEAWFRAERRDLPWRRRYEPYEIWVAEVMLQQTRMEVVVPYFDRFVARFPDLRALAAAEEGEVLAQWSGLGYYRRARMLHAGARWIVSNGGDLPDDPERLLEVPGIGRYTAGAIASIAFDRPAPVVDGNVERLAARVEALDMPRGGAALSEREWAWAEALVRRAASPRSLNQGLMELGAMVCRPRSPRCGECPVASLCRARRAGDPERYPVRKREARAVRRNEDLFIVRDGSGRILVERSNGMVLLPGGARFARGEHLGSFRHAIMKSIVEFDVWTGEAGGAVADAPAEAVWLDPAELSSVPHPSWVRKALALVRTDVPSGHGENPRRNHA